MAPEAGGGPAVPARVGRFLLDGPVGYGGVSVVVRAHEGERSVAVKLLDAGLLGDASARERFLDGARRSVALRHPAVSSVHEIGEHDGRPYAVRPWIEGLDLASALARRGPLSPARSLALAESLARVLDALHASGHAHGGLHPGKVLLAPAGVTLLGPGSDGTFGPGGPYLAPERVAGASLAPSADVYGLAAVIQACLTGSAPGALRVRANGLVEAPRTPDVGALAPALDPDPDARPATCGALVRALRASLEPEAAPPAPASHLPARRRRLLPVAAAVAVVVALGVVAARAIGDSDGVAASAPGPQRTGPAEALSSRIPETFHSSCRPAASPLGVQAALACRSGPVRVTYALYADARSAADAIGTASAPVNAGRCADGAPEQRAWQHAAGAAVVGVVRCERVGGLARLSWSTDALAIVAVAERADGDLAALWSWWLREGGPELAP